MTDKIIDEVMGLVDVHAQAIDSNDAGYANTCREAIRAKLREVLERKPLSDGEIIESFRIANKVPTGYIGWVRDQRIEYGRAIERAHNIGAEQ